MKAFNKLTAKEYQEEMDYVANNTSNILYNHIALVVEAIHEIYEKSKKPLSEILDEQTISNLRVSYLDDYLSREYKLTMILTPDTSKWQVSYNLLEGILPDSSPIYIPNKLKTEEYQTKENIVIWCTDGSIPEFTSSKEDIINVIKTTYQENPDGVVYRPVYVND